MKMKRVYKWLIGIGIGLAAVLIIAGLVGIWFVCKPWPEVSGTIKVPGLYASVQIERNTLGVPHIYAENEHDLFFAQGYVHAQDRLWQMEFFRRFSRGTLSEILGKNALYWDRQSRYFGLYRIAKESWAEMDNDTRVMMTDYAEGVNAYMNSHRDRLPLEFTLLGVDPEPWTPVDTLAWGTLIAYFTQRFNHDYELFRAKLVAEMGEQAAEDLLPPYAPDTPVIIPSEAKGYDWLRGAALRGPGEGGKFIGDLTFWGSGAWVVSGKYTESGKPMLANDPHLPTWLPGVWYENGLHGGRFDVVGYTLPGVPWVLVGHNKRIAWGFANMNPDVEDFYIEKLDDPKHPAKYEYMGKWYDLKTIRETIKVKNDEPVVFDIHFTRHGPIMNELFGLPDTAQPLSHHWAVSDGREVTRALALVNMAGNWREFREALKYWEAIGQTFIYADVDGNIGLQTAGIVPIRVPGHLGVVPVPGWTGTYEWQGYIPPDRMPRVYNPSCGYLFSANSRVAPENYPYLISYDWYSPGYRARRLEQLLQEHIAAGKAFSMQDMRDMQADTYSIPDALLLPYLQAVKPENEREAKALAYAKSWDLHCDTQSVGAAVFETWASFLIDDTLYDELGRHGLLDYAGPYNWLKKTVAMIGLMQKPHSRWFDNIDTPEVETRDDIVRRSFSHAMEWLSKYYGDNPDEWKWGRIHTVRFAHTPFDNAGPVLRGLFSSETYPVAGSNFSIDLMYCWRGEKAFEVWSSAALRVIMDVSDWDRMLAANATGQSGQVFHPNRQDQIQQWLDVGHHVLPFDRNTVEATFKTRLTLEPGK
jgi:penicillin amidase